MDDVSRLCSHECRIVSPVCQIVMLRPIGKMARNARLQLEALHAPQLFLFNELFKEGNDDEKMTNKHIFFI